MKIFKSPSVRNWFIGGFVFGVVYFWFPIFIFGSGFSGGLVHRLFNAYPFLNNFGDVPLYMMGFNFSLFGPFGEFLLGMDSRALSSLLLTIPFGLIWGLIAVFVAKPLISFFIPSHPSS